MKANQDGVISAVSGAGAFVVLPVRQGAIVTKRDQVRLGALQTWRRAQFASVHFLAERRAEVLRRVKSAKLSKPMRVVEITDAQWGRRFKDGETIPGTGINATAVQLRKAFVVGEVR